MVAYHVDDGSTNFDDVSNADDNNNNDVDPDNADDIASSTEVPMAMLRFHANNIIHTGAKVGKVVLPSPF